MGHDISLDVVFFSISIVKYLIVIHSHFIFKHSAFTLVELTKCRIFPRYSCQFPPPQLVSETNYEVFHN